MKIATAHLTGVSSYSQSRPHNTSKLDKEAADDYERRTWLEKCHANSDDTIFIPPMAFHQVMSEIAQFLGTQIKGRGRSTYTKHYGAGILIPEAPALMKGGIAVLKGDFEADWRFMHASGKRGSGTRVWRCYPMIQEWDTVVVFYVLDDTITDEIFEFHLNEAGKFIGIGRFRPINKGFYGRFKVDKIEWSEQD